MSDELSRTSAVDVLRAITSLAGQETPDPGADRTMVALLGHLLVCEAVLTPADESVRVMPRHGTDDDGAPTVLLIQGTVDGVVCAEVELRRRAECPFGEREQVLVGLLRPHVAGWLTRLASQPGRDEGCVITQRQLEILALVRCGLSNKEIARALSISQATVRKHLENAFVRLGAVSRTAAVAAAFPPPTARAVSRV